MIKFENVDVWGFQHAIRGMRNPMNSWEFSDSTYEGEVKLGCNDRDLMSKLIKAGQSHRKFLRQIFVSVDIIAPLYWWKEFDTYKVGTVANSCSTMHQIHAREFSIDDFSCEHLLHVPIPGKVYSPKAMMETTVSNLNMLRDMFRISKDKEWWWQMIQLLPSSYNQKRTVTMTYENLLNMLEHRRDHKLDEWRDFCNWILTLPLSHLLSEGIEQK